MNHWLSPNFFAFFSATVISVAFLGEMLCTCFNLVGFNWLASSESTELEMVVIDWLANKLKLPSSFMFSGTSGGVLQGTTSESILCTLIAARDQALRIVGVHNIRKLIVYGSDQTHSTFTKAWKLAGTFPCNIRWVGPTLPLGTPSTTVVHHLTQIGNLANDYGVRLHVDAAYGGNAGHVASTLLLAILGAKDTWWHPNSCCLSVWRTCGSSPALGDPSCRGYVATFQLLVTLGAEDMW
ncbi:unnamed protein product [Ilex paraguariensis]|uniref:Uncharacterized protein n=1 Tax=Ilex paraguariensis TaxID=185542 RepID=A0ABC8SWN3_9AQUA